MTETASSLLTPWSNFYVVTGSSAGALTGLMFVVITLVNRIDHAQTGDGIATFSTPTVLHFCGALLISVISIAPWRSLFAPAALLGLAGLYGVVHVLRAMYRARRLHAYRADFEDVIAYMVLPLIAYAAIVGGAVALPVAPGGALFAVAAAAVLLLFMGIRNAWDIVTYLVIEGAANIKG